jgi:hypothetical protein
MNGKFRRRAAMVSVAALSADAPPEPARQA